MFRNIFGPKYLSGLVFDGTGSLGIVGRRIAKATAQLLQPENSWYKYSVLLLLQSPGLVKQ